MSLYSQAQIAKAVKRAIEAVEARIAGKQSVKLGKGAAAQAFNLEEKGYCNRFVRQVYETALDLPAFGWRFGAARACVTLEKLEPYKVGKQDRQPGDVIGFPGDPGHIAIYLGEYYGDGRELIAENTSSTRGYPSAPGTKITRWSAVSGRVSGVYRLGA